MNYRSNALDTAEDSYFSRNRLWLIPLMVGFIVVTAPALSEMLQLKDVLPSAVTTAGGVLCAFALGVGAIRTDTLSAYIVARLGLAVGLVIAGVAIWKHLI